MPALATALAAFGWGIVEPLLPVDLERGGCDAAGEIGADIHRRAHRLRAVRAAGGWASERVAIRWVIIFGVVGMACSLAALGQSRQARWRSAAGSASLSAAFAFTLNPASAELGNAVDRRGLSCYAAVYAVYNIAYSVGMMATNALAGTAGFESGLPQILLCASAALLVCVPLLLVKDRKLPAAVTATSKDQPV